LDATDRNQRGISEHVNAVIKRLRQEVPECLASGVVDLATGMLLTYETTDSHPSEVLDLLAGATLELFQGRTVTMIEDLFKERRGVNSAERYFQEILVNSSNLTHLFIRNNVNEDIVVVVVCPKSANIGMLFAAARRVIKENGDF
jgi:predicted regulator of Ras-like GTPase activity (Roadblock/LC7/MglB family)